MNIDKNEQPIELGFKVEETVREFIQSANILPDVLPSELFDFNEDGLTEEQIIEIKQEAANEVLKEKMCFAMAIYFDKPSINKNKDFDISFKMAFKELFEERLRVDLFEFIENKDFRGDFNGTNEVYDKILNDLKRLIQETKEHNTVDYYIEKFDHVIDNNIGLENDNKHNISEQLSYLVTEIEFQKTLEPNLKIKGVDFNVKNKNELYRTIVDFSCNEFAGAFIPLIEETFLFAQKEIGIDREKQLKNETAAFKI